MIVEGAARPLPPGLDLCAYRIVQESLTNVVKHAGPARAEIRMTYGPATLALRITDDGAAATGSSRLGSRLDRHDRTCQALRGTLAPGRCRRRIRGAGELPAVPARRQPQEASVDDQSARGRRPGADPRRACRAADARPTSRWWARPPTARRRSRWPPAIKPDVVLMDIRMPGMDGHRRATGGSWPPPSDAAAGAHPDHVRPGRVRLRRAAGRAPAASCSRTPRPSG